MNTTRQDVGTQIGQTPSAATLTLVKPSVTTAIDGIRVFDVGQGDCIGIRDQKGDVFCYVDYGGVIDHPDKTNPGNTPTRLPVRYAGGYVSIVLTHWDKDHYYSAYNKNTDAQNCEWLTPRQWAAPFAVRFAAKLPNAKCWPETLGRATHRFAIGARHVIEIRKCATYDPRKKKQDRNTCGLAITLLEQDAGATQAQMLLAGDCHFDGIPNLQSAPICRLVAYHHGSHTGWTSATESVISNVAPSVSMVYSFGSSNTYGHPDRANYQPTWDANAQQTPDLRSAGMDYEDLSW
jgi:hypothetical protein